MDEIPATVELRGAVRLEEGEMLNVNAGVAEGEEMNEITLRSGN